jgi:SecD/SecF fusion protein
MLAATSVFEDPLALFLLGLGLLILFFWYFATEIERRKRNIGSVLLVGICVLCIAAFIPPKERLKGGIDILGGSEFTLRVQPREAEDGTLEPVTHAQVDQAIEVIEKRLNRLGTADSLIIRQGDDGILVQMPGVGPAAAAGIRTTLETVAKLELREVNRRSDETGPDGRTLAERVSTGDEIVPGYRAYAFAPRTEDGVERPGHILLNRRIALGGGDISVARPSQQRADAVDITLNSPGTDKMIAFTSNLTAGVDRMAIVLDGEVLSAPGFVTVPLGRNFQITGLKDPGEASELASALMNPLENPLVVEAFQAVSPTLGAAIVEQGIWAAAVGLSLTFLFVLAYYRTAGIIALFGLLVNGIILFGVMAMFEFTFTLPGIAGIILTIGMAVDANVLIYERLREELDNGKSLKNAIAAAYDKAFSAIFDANVTSLITAIILLWMASGNIKGFAITLTVGLLASMFSAILVTRVLYRWGIDTSLLRKLSFLNLIRAANFDFLGKRRTCFAVSAALAVAALGGFIYRGEDALGIDFTGGTRIQFQLGEQEIPLADVRRALSELDLTREAYPQEASNPASGTTLSIRADTADANAIEAKMREAIPLLAEMDPASGAYLIDASRVEISSAIGMSFLRESIIALIAGMIGIMIYITLRFELSFAIGAIVALLHDVGIAVGLIVLFGGELSLIHVGAILAIAGYSINDTIVVFDRIRETLMMRSGSIKDIMNAAINATLSRTILTSATTIATVAILAVFGGDALRAFSVMILAGLVIGTYSSIFVAAPVVLWWSRRKGRNLRRDVLDANFQAEVVPAAK